METSLSLLDTLRTANDDEAWRRLVDLYTPLIGGWLRRQGLANQDADDVVQEVLSVVFRKLPAFQRQEQAGSFRSWLRAITVNCLRDFRKQPRNRRQAAANSDFVKLLTDLEDPNSGASRMWDEEHNRYLTQRLLEMICPEFQESTWRAFQRVTLEGANATDVATELGMSVNAVFIAKSRVMTRLRQEGRGLLD